MLMAVARYPLRQALPPPPGLPPQPRLRGIHRGSQDKGISVLEATIALALLSFVLLASLDLQTRSLSRLNQSQTRLSNYLKLLEWRPVDLSGPDCALQSAPDDKTFLVCTRADPDLQAQTRACFALE